MYISPFSSLNLTAWFWKHLTFSFAWNSLAVCGIVGDLFSPTGEVWVLHKQNPKSRHLIITYLWGTDGINNSGCWDRFSYTLDKLSYKLDNAGDTLKPVLQWRTVENPKPYMDTWFRVGICNFSGKSHGSVTGYDWLMNLVWRNQ